MNTSFGKLTIINESILNGKKYYLCKCTCGKIKQVNKRDLLGGKTKSCGCSRIKHGFCVGKTIPEVSAFLNAKSRCNNPNRENYKNYGGRGIQFLYKNFQEFIDDVGMRPTNKHSLDRIDNNGHYAKGNCRWASREQQIKNRRFQIDSYYYNGESIIQAAKRLQCSSDSLYRRIRVYKWSKEKAFTTPSRHKK
jgi:Mor family transcriptional regulator